MSDTEQFTKNPLAVHDFKDDSLGMEDYCRSLEEYLKIEHEFTEGSLVASLNARFGQGKSSLLKMWENDLHERREKEPQTALVINLNAWDSDYYGEPLIPIISELVDSITEHLPDRDSSKEQLIEKAKDVAWFFAGLANSAIPLDAFGAGDIVEQKKKAREGQKEAIRPDMLDDYRKRKDAILHLKRLLKETIGGDQPKAFVFIDELDRCRPDYAVSYLETIKHVFDIHGLVFVLAVDYDHLENSAMALYGPKLKFPEYFRKFVHRSFEMPKPRPDKLQDFTRELTHYYLENKSTRFTQLDLRNSWGRLPELMTALDMTPRQAIEFFRLLGHLSSSKTDYAQALYVGYGIGMMLMCALKVAKPVIYMALGRGESPHDEIIDILKHEIESSNDYWWFSAYLGGFADYSVGYQVLKSHELLQENETRAEVEESIQGTVFNLWRRRSHGASYPQIYKQIETIALE